MVVAMPVRPARSSTICGNCFLAVIGVPTELGLTGLLVVAVSLFKIPYCSTNVFYWCCAMIGVALTPAVIGLPLFAFAFLALLLPVMNVLLKRAATVFRP
jgi:hypothetical protein